MTQITSAIPETGGGRKRAGVRRMIKHNLRIDMTPMVDLGFLLITFFVITAQLSEPRAMQIITPKEADPQMPLGESNALTILPAASNTLYYYQGKWEEALQSGHIYQISYAGENSLRKVIIRKQAALDADPNNKEKRDGLMLVIKPSATASYKNMVDVLDEVTINQVKKYTLVSISTEEATWLKGLDQEVINQ
jgi:biopolymer transport protein ExbD